MQSYLKSLVEKMGLKPVAVRLVTAPQEPTALPHRPPSMRVHAANALGAATWSAMLTYAQRCDYAKG